MSVDLSSASFFRALKKLRLIVKRNIRSHRAGERLSQKKGGSLEFMDYRQYTPGDDVRAIDWNLWGRLDKLYVRLFHSEESTRLSFLVDSSASMGFGTPEKWQFALQFVAAMSWVALEDRDEVCVRFFAKNLFGNISALCRGDFLKLAKKMESLSPQGESSLEGLGREFISRERHPCVLFVISDFYFEPDQVLAFAKELSWYCHELHFIHILSREETEIHTAGLTFFEDSETTKREEVFCSKGWVSQYRKMLDDHCIALESGIRTMGGRYWRVDSCSDLLDLVLQMLKGK